MPTHTVQLYTPHAGQMQLHSSPARFRVMAAGRRWGKTLACSNEISKHVLEHNDVSAMWVAPTYRATSLAFRMMSKALRDVLSAPPNKSELHLELINGSDVTFASAERYENLRGIGLSFLVLDEVAQIVAEAWTEALRPTLSDTGGRAIFISTPKGRGFFWDLFQRGLDPSEKDWASFTFPTSSNPYIPASEIEAARRDLPEAAFQQEYEAVFLDESAGVFYNVDACVAGDVEDPQPGHTYVVGWDPAKYEDFSVVTVLDIETHHVAYFERIHHVDYEDQFALVSDIARRYNFASVEMDATGVGDPLVEQLRKRNVQVNGVKFGNVNKEQYIRNLALLLQNKTLTYPRITVLLNELKQYEYHFTTQRRIVYGAPAGKHDDTVISLALAAWKIQEGGTIPFEITATHETGISLRVEKSADDWLMRRQESIANSLLFVKQLQTFGGMDIADM